MLGLMFHLAVRGGSSIEISTKDAETPISLNEGIYLKIMIGTRIRFKVYSLIKGYWSLWGRVQGG